MAGESVGLGPSSSSHPQHLALNPGFGLLSACIVNKHTRDGKIPALISSVQMARKQNCVETEGCLVLKTLSDTAVITDPSEHTFLAPR